MDNALVCKTNNDGSIPSFTSYFINSMNLLHILNKRNHIAYMTLNSNMVYLVIYLSIYILGSIVNNHYNQVYIYIYIYDIYIILLLSSIAMHIYNNEVVNGSYILYKLSKIGVYKYNIYTYYYNFTYMLIPSYILISIIYRCEYYYYYNICVDILLLFIVYSIVITTLYVINNIINNINMIYTIVFPFYM